MSKKSKQRGQLDNTGKQLMKTYRCNGLRFAVLSADNISFLDKYVPEDEMFTSSAEMSLVEASLGLNGMTLDELQYIRNSVVNWYHDLMACIRKANGGMTNERFWSLMTAMQSVTAVIDNKKFDYNPDSI